MYEEETQVARLSIRLSDPVQIVEYDTSNENEGWSIDGSFIKVIRGDNVSVYPVQRIVEVLEQR